LPISRQIVEHFGGRLWLESEPGQGAVFGFFLPVQL
jgi:signal transduction histidine kinase